MDSLDLIVKINAGNEKAKIIIKNIDPCNIYEHYNIEKKADPGLKWVRYNHTLRNKVSKRV